MAVLEGESLTCCAIVRRIAGGGYAIELPDLPALGASGASEQKALADVSRRLNAHLRDLARPGRAAAGVPPSPRNSADRR